MHRVCRLTGGVACLVLLLWGGLSWGEPPNPTPSDNLGNTAGGLHALSDNTTGYDNTAFGIGALLNNMDGSVNTASGAYALLRNTTGDLNTASGAYALRNNMTGDSNTAVGESALGFNISGSGNIALGRWAGLILTSGDRNIYLGNLGAAAESDTMRLGGVQTRTFIAGITGVPVSGSTMLISSTGQVGIEVSSARYKRDIQPMGALSRGLLQLRPVTFRYKQDMQGERQYGLIAEEVASIYPELVTYDARGEAESVRYQEVIPMLFNELQHQQRQLGAQAQQLAELQAQNTALAARLLRLEEAAARVATRASR